ncbi:MAG: hypothetical protein ACI4HO_09195 [Ruminococcus sp.]
MELCNVKLGQVFKIGDIEYIKMKEDEGRTIAVTKDIIFNLRFGNNNNLHTSDVFEKLNNEFLPKVAEVVGFENICNITTDLTTFDGLKPYEPLTSKISLPTLDFYRENVEIFDKYKINQWWWLATPESAQPHDDPDYVLCVSPSGFIFNDYNNDDNNGVRPLLNFVSSISVSCEE